MIKEVICLLLIFNKTFNQCLSSYWSTSCVPQKADGQECSSPSECLINICNYGSCNGQPPKLDSTILSATQQTSLLNLIGFQTNSFSLLWRGTRDGFAASTFHSLCDNKGSTLTVVKTTTGYIAGGYASVSWASIGNYIVDSNTFLYTLINPSNMPMKLAVTIPMYALFNYASYGPTFGGGHDLRISDASNTNTMSYSNFHSYSNPNGNSGYAGGSFMLGASSFQVAEVEVFVVKEMDSAILDSTSITNLLNLIGMFFRIINIFLS